MKTINIEGKDFTIEHLKELIAKEETKPNWREDFKGRYCPYLDGFGNWICDKTTDECLNHYKEEEHVPVEKIALLCDMEEWARVHNDGWVADWNDGDQEKFGVGYDGYEFGVDTCVLQNSFIFQIALKNKRTAEKFYDEFKDRLHIVNK